MKHVLLTGISRGLGLALATKLLTKGYGVFGVSRSQTDDILTLEKEFSNFHFLSFDLSNPEAIKNGLLKRKLMFDIPIQAFINNAAKAYDDIISNLNYQSLEDMFKVNVFSPLMITKFIIRNMLLHKTKGVIIHISSISVHTGYKGLSMYASTKGALEAFSKNTAREWGSKGIRSNVVVPGFMETAMSSTLSDAQKKTIANRTALKELTDIESVSNTVAFLISEEAKSITGQNIHVDSGTI